MQLRFLYDGTERCTGMEIQMARILVVEDDALISELITLNLNVSGYEWDAAYDGKQAREIISQRKFDLAFLDINLPEMDGFELMTYMKEKNIPVIYVSARSTAADRIHGLKLGADDYLVKPFDVMELIVRMEKVLSRTLPKTERIDIHDVHVDIENHVVMQRGQAIELKPMEFSLLLIFSKNRHKVLSRELLLNEVWGESFEGETRTIDVHIASLRKKLGWQELIKTVPKYGYKLV
ncbi:MAG: response regulator transcription factor [Clostridia bacterium]